jgi:hypothetical protein
MFKKFGLLAFLIILHSTTTFADVPRLMPILSKQRKDLNFAQAKKGFEQRWNAFAKNRKFSKYQPNFVESELWQEFENIKRTRQAIYYDNPGQIPQQSKIEYERSQLLMTGGYFKCLHHIAFEYNYSHPSYNSSNIILDGYRFLALEGPQKPAHVNNFLRLLINYDVRQLVRLTTDYDQGSFKTENYWKNSVQSNNNDQQFLTFRLEEEDPSQTIPYSIQYYATNDWQDFSGTNANDLFRMVQTVRQDHKPDQIVAIHCSAGVGRTGTFIAAMLLLNDIDRQLQAGTSKEQIKLSIEELVYKLSLQRAYAVAEPQQYVNLHQLVKIYLADKA